MSSQARAAGPVVGEAAPDLQLRDLNRKIVRLSDFAYPDEPRPNRPKKAVLLDFFRTDCAPCRKELPQIVAYHEANKDQVQVLLIALLEPEDGRKKLKAFLKDHPVPFPVLLDTYEIAAKNYIAAESSFSLPCMFLVSPDGLVRKRIEGLTSNLEEILRLPD